LVQPKTNAKTYTQPEDWAENDEQKTTKMARFFAQHHICGDPGGMHRAYSPADQRTRKPAQPNPGNVGPG
jgi:hypothetical protein